MNECGHTLKKSINHYLNVYERIGAYINKCIGNKKFKAWKCTYIFATFYIQPILGIFFCTSEFHSETSLNLKIRFSKPFIELFVRKGLESVK